METKEETDMCRSASKIRVPDKDPITPVEAAKALCLSVADVYRLIYEGKFGAFNIASDSAKIAMFRIPLKNFVQYINGIYSDELLFRFPAANPLSPGRIAKALQCSDQHIYNQIRDGEFPNAINLARKDSIRSEWKIPLCDLVAYVNRRREGAFQ